VVAVAFLGVLVLVGAALGVVAAMIHAHRQAQSAADLAALAAAGALAHGGDACASAEHIAGTNHARLDACVVEGREVVVEVTVAGPHWLGQNEDLRARARAGPG
jgi:secretion/DNA translocation related TadE-like protein